MLVSLEWLNDYCDLSGFDPAKIADILMGLGFEVTEMVAGSVETSIFNLQIASNRGDCLSYIGIARELAAKLGRPLSLPLIPALQSSVEKGKEKIAIRIAGDAACTRFTALGCKGLRAVAAPVWMQNRLKASGLRPHNIIIDVTNYCMLEWGQPVHAYDASLLAQPLLELRGANKGECLTTLDGIDHRLEPGDLLVGDGEKPIALAGISGSALSGVRLETTGIIIQVAAYAGMAIQKTAQRLGLMTEASKRFIYGVDEGALVQVANRAVALLRLCGHEVGLTDIILNTEIVDVYPARRSAERIALRLPRVRSLLGIPFLSLDRCVKHLEALGFCLLDKTNERMLFEIPTFRQDVKREIDLIEEIARLEGYEKIPCELPRLELHLHREEPFIEFCQQIKTTLANFGHVELLTPPFQKLADVQDLRLHPQHPVWPNLTLGNPFSKDAALLQTSCIPQLLQALQKNRRQNQHNGHFFELARSYRQAGEVVLQSTVDLYSYYTQKNQPAPFLSAQAKAEKGRPVERQLLAGAYELQEGSEQSFCYGQQLLERMCWTLGLPELNWHRPPEGELLWLHPSAATIISVEKTVIGWFGELHPETALKLGFNDPAPHLYEIDLASVFAFAGGKAKMSLSQH